MADDLTSATVGSTTTTYNYDGTGNRLSASDGTNTTNYLWDDNTVSGLSQLARESDGSGSLVRRYLSDAEGLSTLQTGAGSFYFLRDQQGSVAQVSDGSANTEWKYAYEPFGTTASATKVDPSAPDNLVQFDGQYLDAAAGLYDLRARQYDPADSAFLTSEPLAPALRDPYVSAYVYVGSSPTMFDDPTGLMKWCVVKQVCQAASSAASAAEGAASAVGNAASAAPHAAGEAIHAVYEADKFIIHVGENVVVGTAEQIVGLIQDSIDCITGVASGEMRSASRQCLKTAAVITAVLATDGAIELVSGLLERFGGTEGLSLLLRRIWAEVRGSPAAEPAARGGETAATAFGRSAHKAWDPGPGFQKEFSIVEDGRVIARMDAINARDRIIKELKPDTPSGRAAGPRQLERYRQIAEEKFGGDWTVILETYKAPAP